MTQLQQLSQVAPQQVAPPARLELGGLAPDFQANTTHGPIKFSEWQAGRWVILFSHPADFTPVCTTEFVEFAKRAPELEKKNVALLGNSIDSIYSHIAWIRNIEQHLKVSIPFPVVADLDQNVARLFGMLHVPSSVTATVRCVFFIDPKRVLRAMIYYPMNVGRHFDEITRVVDALQTADKHGVACPANWVPGDAVIVPAPITVAAAQARVGDKQLQVTDWYLSRKSLT